MTTKAQRSRPEPRAFSGQAEFRAWLERNHATTTELFLRLSKVAATNRGLTRREALDEALCYGWIDGVVRRLDADSFSQRYTPRRSGSAWSKVNVKRFRELEAEGRVRPAGRKAFDVRVKSHYSFESKPQSLSPALQRSFRARARAWSFFKATPAWYQRTCSFYVMSAKQPQTRERRLGVLISHCARGEALRPLKLPATLMKTRAKKR